MGYGANLFAGVTAESDSNYWQRVSFANDGNATTYWIGAPPYYLLMPLASAKVLSKYTLDANTASGNYTLRFTIEGSNDKTNWTVIDDQTTAGISFWSAAPYVKEFLLPNNTTAYRYYRYKTVTRTGSDWCTLTEWQGFESVNSTPMNAVRTRYNEGVVL